MKATQPNILLVMADQLAVPTLPFYGHPVVQAPHLSQLAQNGVVFDSAYCNFPICAPSRFSMLSGRLPHAIAAYDNASEFPAAIPTMSHYLRHVGYRTILCGKMHFIGPDQLHGYEERLTTDIYPADFAWTPDWTKGPAHRPTGVSMRPVVESGPCIRSMQIDYDDEVEYRAVQRLHDLARAPEQQPFFMTVSFTHCTWATCSRSSVWKMFAGWMRGMMRLLATANGMSSVLIWSPSRTRSTWCSTVSIHVSGVRCTVRQRFSRPRCRPSMVRTSVALSSTVREGWRLRTIS